MHVRYRRAHAVRGVDLDLDAGTVTALMGRNGAGKSSLLWALAGAGPRSAGTVAVRRDGRVGADPASLVPADRARELVALVPQDPMDLVYLSTVADECAAGDAQAGAPPGTCAALLARFAGPVAGRCPPA